MVALILLLLIIGAWFVPILWVAVAVVIVFWVINKMADEKIANMTAQLPSYEQIPNDDTDDETLILRSIK